MKKRFLIIAAASALVLAVSGCSSSQTQQTAAAVEESAEEESAEEKNSGQEAAGDENSTEEAESAEDDVLVRDTEYGKVEGTRVDNALVWYGIPYGKNPTGELRWAAPEDPDPWSDVYDASDWADVAMQLSGSDIIGTEDCLNLDIYSTEDAKDYPVLVFLHGGNNQTGNTKELIGVELAENDGVVLVSLNYRLGLLGFNCLPALQTEDDSTGNYALLDIAKGLDWVKENIAQFGGDPDNVTISGFSAGGRDVMAMLISPIFEGKFDKAIAFSGGMTVADVDLSAAKIAKAIAPFAVEDGVADTEEEAVEYLLGTGDDVKEYLYSISPERLSTLMGNAGIRMSVFPHLYSDGTVIPEEGFDTTYYNSVPLLMLSGTSEFTMFAAGDPYFTGEDLADLTDEELEAAENFVYRYGSDMYGYFNTTASAEKMSENYDAPIYLCLVNYGDESSAYPIDLYGAFHGIFVPMLSTTNNYTSQLPEGTFEAPAYQDMARIFNLYLTNFLNTGDPNGEGLDEWDEWNDDTYMTMIFDGADDAALIECESVKTSYDEIMAEMDADASVTDDVKLGVITHIMNGRWFSDAMDEHYGSEDLWK